MKTEPRSRHPRAIAYLCLSTAFAATPLASAQVSFSIESKSSSIADVSSGAGARPMTSGDVLTPVGGVPLLVANVTNAVPPPVILFGGDPLNAGLAGDLGIQSHAECVGLGENEACPTDLDALSFGVDDLITLDGGGSSFSGLAEPKARWNFSVDGFAIGVAGLPQDPSVESENRVIGGGGRAGDSSADIFIDLGFAMLPPLSPLDPVSGNIGIVDGNGEPSLSTFFVYPGVGLKEPNFPPVPPAPGDDLDAIDVGGSAFPTGSGVIYYSLTSAYFDPKTGLANNGSAAANGFVGGDVIIRSTMGPLVYAAAATLGLDQFGMGADSDDLDALTLAENGMAGYQVSMTPYDWDTGTTDMLMFSLRRDSEIIKQGKAGNAAAFDSIFGVPIEEGDILVPPVMGGNGNPGIFIAAEVLGLRTSRTHFDPCGDDLDALDYEITEFLIQQEYCYGDGGVTVGAMQCTPCPCGNDMPPGIKRGCMNGVGQGARLVASGLASVSVDTLRMTMTGGNPSTFGMLVTAPSRLPLMGTCAGAGIAQPTLLDGLRCIGGGSVVRSGARPTDAGGSIGITTPGWGTPDGPPGGILAWSSLVACQTHQFQVFYREDPMLVCGTAQNTSNAIQVTTTL